MKKYEVTIYYTTNITLVVEAENEDGAIANAYADAGKPEYDDQILNNVTADYYTWPDVKEVEEDE